MPVKKIIKKKVALKKKSAKKPVKKVAAKQDKLLRQAQDKPIGVVTHYFRKIKVAVVKFKSPVSSGTKLRFKGATTNFAMKIGSIQYNHKELKRAPKGKQVGIKVSKRVRKGDTIYLEK